MRPDYSNAHLLPCRYATGADIAAAARSVGLSADLMAREIGIGADTMRHYVSGARLPPRHVLLAVQCVHDLYMARRASGTALETSPE